MKANRLRYNSASFATLTIALALAACDNEELANDLLADGPVALSVTADISTVATRVSDAGTSFSNGDRIGIFPVKSGQVEAAQVNRLYIYNGTEFGSTSPYWFQDLQTVTFYAYYPYDATLTADDYTIDIDTRAGNQVNGTFNGNTWRKNDYLAASAQTSVTNPEVSFTGGSVFSHVMSQIQFVFVAGTDVGVNNLDNLAKYKIATTLAMDGIFDPVKKAVVLDENFTGETIEMNIEPTSAQTRVNATPLILLPQTIGDKLNIEVTYNSQTYKAELDAPTTKSLEPGYSYTYTVTISNTGLKVDNATINDWFTADHYDGSGDATLQ